MPDTPLEAMAEALQHAAAGMNAMTEAVRAVQAESAIFSMLLAQLIANSVVTRRRPRREAEALLAAAAQYADGLRADLRSDPAAMEAVDALVERMRSLIGPAVEMAEAHYQKHWWLRPWR